MRWKRCWHCQVRPSRLLGHLLAPKRQPNRWAQPSPHHLMLGRTSQPKRHQLLQHRLLRRQLQQVQQRHPQSRQQRRPLLQQLLQPLQPQPK